MSVKTPIPKPVIVQYLVSRSTTYGGSGACGDCVGDEVGVPMNMSIVMGFTTCRLHLENIYYCKA